MNGTRLTWDVLRLAGHIRPRQFTIRPTGIRFAHRRPYNEDIKREYVQVVNAEGKLDPPASLASILASIDLKRYFVELVTDDQSIVKILNKDEEYAKAKARARAKKSAPRPPEQKEIQMTWGVAAGDLQHKLNKVRKELEKRNRVDLIFAPKKRMPVPNPEERDARAREVLEVLKDVGTEWKPRTFQRALMTLHLQGLDLVQKKPIDPES